LWLPPLREKTESMYTLAVLHVPGFHINRVKLVQMNGL
jgi:hypothetical protein